ncbi:MAG: hypothetical protein H0V12_05530 [Chloroflexi bacterium]|nr:hypothetical protein [Chloroflexota bacterium]
MSGRPRECTGHRQSNRQRPRRGVVLGLLNLSSLVYSNSIRGTTDGIVVELFDDDVEEINGSATIRFNRISDVDRDGIHVESGAGSNIVINTVSGSGRFDCFDATTGEGTRGTANEWRANKGTTANPSGICRPPA